MYGNTIIGVVGPPYPYCLLVAFCAFAWLRLCAFGAFSAFGACKIFSQKKINKEFNYPNNLIYITTSKEFYHPIKCRKKV